MNAAERDTTRVRREKKRPDLMTFLCGRVLFFYGDIYHKPSFVELTLTLLFACLQFSITFFSVI